MNKIIRNLLIGNIVGECVICYLIIQSHNKQIEAMIDRARGLTIHVTSYMGLRERKEYKAWKKEYDEIWKNK